MKLESIEIAKENGSWTSLDKVENLEIPKDLKKGIGSQNGALQYFENLTKSSKKSLLYWVLSAKGENTREKRISEIVENARSQMIPKQFR